MASRSKKLAAGLASLSVGASGPAPGQVAGVRRRLVGEARAPGAESEAGAAPAPEARAPERRATRRPPTPRATPTASPTSTPIATPTPAPPAGEDAALDELRATHSEREHQVWEAMAAGTIGRGTSDAYFRTSDLIEATSFRNHITIRKAVDGLLAKRSIAIVRYRHGDPAGPLYRVHPPEEILALREREGLRIDGRTKRLLPSDAAPSYDPLRAPGARGSGGRR